MSIVSGYVSKSLRTLWSARQRTHCLYDSSRTESLRTSYIAACGHSAHKQLRTCEALYSIYYRNGHIYVVISFKLSILLGNITCLCGIVSVLAYWAVDVDNFAYFCASLAQMLLCYYWFMSGLGCFVESRNHVMLRKVYVCCVIIEYSEIVLYLKRNEFTQINLIGNFYLFDGVYGSYFNGNLSNLVILHWLMIVILNPRIFLAINYHIIVLRATQNHNSYLPSCYGVG